MSLAKEIPVCNMVINIDFLTNRKYPSVYKDRLITGAEVLMEYFKTWEEVAEVWNKCKW